MSQSKEDYAQDDELAHGDKNQDAINANDAGGFRDTLDLGETFTGATTPQPYYVDKSDNKVYQCDGDVIAKLNFAGFVLNSGIANADAEIQNQGIVRGFAGLDEGELYYLSNTKGAISKTAYSNKLVGIAISATEILIMKKDPTQLVQDFKNPIPFNKSVTPFSVANGGVTVASGKIAVITHWYATTDHALQIDDSGATQRTVLSGKANLAIVQHIFINPFLVDESTDIQTSASTATAFGYYIDKDPRITPITEMVNDSTQYTVPAGKLLVILNVYSSVNTSLVSADLGIVMSVSDLNKMTDPPQQSGVHYNPIIFGAGDVLDSAGVGLAVIINGYLIDIS